VSTLARGFGSCCGTGLFRLMCASIAMSYGFRWHVNALACCATACSTFHQRQSALAEIATLKQQVCECVRRARCLCQGFMPPTHPPTHTHTHTSSRAPPVKVRALMEGRADPPLLLPAQATGSSGASDVGQQLADEGVTSAATITSSTSSGSPVRVGMASAASLGASSSSRPSLLAARMALAGAAPLPPIHHTGAGTSAPTTADHSPFTAAAAALLLPPPLVLAQPQSNPDRGATAPLAACASTPLGGGGGGLGVGGGSAPIHQPLPPPPPRPPPKPARPLAAATAAAAGGLPVPSPTDGAAAAATAP
jgi:hypothetical protein